MGAVASRADSSDTKEKSTVIIVDADKLEHVLVNELGKHSASDLIVALEETGALRTVEKTADKTAVVTAEQVERWAVRSLTPGDREWLKLAIPKSSVAEDIGTIAHSLTLPDALIGDDATGSDGRDISDSRYGYIVDCGYFPAMLNGVVRRGHRPGSHGPRRACCPFWTDLVLRLRTTKSALV